MLAPSDAGKTWRRLPISSEPKVGAIAQFWFSSRANGILLLDRTQGGENGVRYELFETMTGGSSWALKQASAQPVIRAGTFPEPRQSGWRLRADAGAAAYRLERGDGERWQTVASFLIAAGECKLVNEQPQPEPEPPASPPVFQIPSQPPSGIPQRPIR